MRAQVSKWGHSLALRIPQALAKELAITEGRMVELTLESGRLIAEPIASPVYDIRALVAQIKQKDEPLEIDTGEPRGHEIW